MCSTANKCEDKSLLAKLPMKFAADDDRSYGAASMSSGLKDEHRMTAGDDKRLYCLDVARIFCVALVVVNHAGKSWTDQFGLYNEMYVQQWVLQWLFIICGMSFAMSSRDTFGYVCRLMTYFVLGVLINWCAFIITGQDWKSNFWNVVFQFWFVFGVAVYVIVLTPLKKILQLASSRDGSWSSVQERSILNGLGAIGCVLVFVHFTFKRLLAPSLDLTLGRVLVAVGANSGAGAHFWGMPGSAYDALPFIQELLSYVQVSIGSVLILWALPKFTARLEFANWVVLLNMFLFRCLWFRGPFARVVDGFDFTLIGLANVYFGLAYRRTIGKYMTRYWFVVLFIFALLLPPGTFGRFDEVPVHDLGMRVRWHLVELTMTVLFLCAAERMADGGIFTEDNLDWLNWWSLYLFLFHRFVHLVFPQPFNWLILILLAPAAWALHGRSNKTPSQMPKEHDSCKDVEKASGMLHVEEVSDAGDTYDSENVIQQEAHRSKEKLSMTTFREDAEKTAQEAADNETSKEKPAPSVHCDFMNDAFAAHA